MFNSHGRIESASNDIFIVGIRNAPEMAVMDVSDA